MPTAILTDHEDAALVIRARAGDDGAYAQLVDRHRLPVLALARSLVDDAAEAEDLAQDAFVRAYGNLALLADPARFGPWLRRIVFGVSIDWLRSSKSELWRRAEPSSSSELPEVPSDAPDALTRLAQDELADRVAAAVRALPETYRIPLTLYHLDGVSHAQVAASLGIAEGTSRSLVTRARRRLQDLLKPYAKEHFAMIDKAADVFEERTIPSMLHILNGDSTRVSLEQSGVPGTMATWADVLHDGEVPPFDVGADRWRQVRARFLSSQGWTTFDEALETLRRWERAIERYAEYDEVVIWCEHDLFDQLLLIRHLAWFAGRDLGRTTLALICIGEWPGRPHFKGLGELAPADLASLLGTRQRVSQRQLELGRRAWKAFTGDDPRAIERLIKEEDLTTLPFLAAALRRLLEEYPSVRDGLVRTDRQILELIAQGKTQLGELFVANHTLESNYFIGDSSFIARLRRLAQGLDALVRLDEGSEKWWKTGTVELTGQGRAVLAGRGNWVRLSGIDEWRGGVHLQGNDAEWRWDADAQRLRGRGSHDVPPSRAGGVR